VQEIQILRTVIFICAPILNNFNLMVSICALGIDVPDKPIRRNVCMSRQATGGKVEPQLVGPHFGRACPIG